MSREKSDDSDTVSASPAPSGGAPDDWYTMDEAAKGKGVSYHTVSRAVRSGKLPFERRGRMVMLNAETLKTWEPMRERAPRKYRQRVPSPLVSPNVVDLASGERMELTRRLTALYEVIHSSAMTQPLTQFVNLLADRFARAMEFDRVVIWVINEARTEIERVAAFGDWFVSPEAANPSVFPFDPTTMPVTEPKITDGIPGYAGTRIVNYGQMFSAPLVAGEHIGYIIGDRKGERFSLSEAQIQLGQSLATQAALTINLNRTRETERRRTRELETVLESISEPVMVYDGKRRILSMSRAARKNYGIQGEIDFNVERFTLEDLDEGRLRRGLDFEVPPPSAEALKGNIVSNYEFVFIRHDTGEARLLLVDAVPIMEDGVVQAVVAVEQDITDRRADEARDQLHREALELALQRQRAIAEIALALNAGADLPEVLYTAGRKIIQLLGGKNGGISLDIDQESHLAFWTFGDDSPLTSRVRLPLRDLQGTLRAFESRKPYLNTYSMAVGQERDFMDESGIRSILCTPLIIEEVLVGAMYVNYLEENPTLTDDMLEFSIQLAAQCTMAIRQDRMHEELLDQVSRLHSASAAQPAQATQIDDLEEKPSPKTGRSHVQDETGNRVSSMYPHGDHPKQKSAD